MIEQFPARSTMTRRRALGTLGGAGLAAFLAACGSDSSSSPAPGSADADGSSRTTGSSAGSSSTASSVPADRDCVVIPDETAGPFPADGSNGPNVLDIDGVVREDLRNSFGELSGVADGIELALQLDLVEAAGCKALAGAAVYAWHCDAEGRYSLYSDGVTDQNYLRGVQAADESGVARFTTIFPGCYPGRWPHVHFEVYESVESATAGGAPIATSQLAFPQGVCEQVYEDARYGGSAEALGPLSLASDGEFGDDGAAQQLATMSGEPGAGLAARLRVAI